MKRKVLEVLLYAGLVLLVGIGVFRVLGIL